MNLVHFRSKPSWKHMAAVGSCLALGLSVFSGGTAGAVTVAPTGSLTCNVSGSASLTPGVPMSGQPATVKWTMEKIHQVPLDTCNSAGVTGGKAPITGGVLQVNARLNPGASCDALGASLASVNKAVVGVKLTNTATSIDPITGLPVVGATRTVASVHLKDVTVSQSGAGVLITGTAQQSASGNKPFGGETVDVQLNGTGDCTTAPLTALSLSGTVSIHS